MTDSKQFKLARRARRVRGKVSGTSAVPRLRVFRSLSNIYAQVIDDRAGKTLASASTLDKDIKQKKIKSNAVDGALAVGELVAKRAKDAKITTVVFDRGGRLYHGRVKAVADGARKGGLKF